MNSCEYVSALLVDYINRRLEQKENSEIVAHLAQCEDCRKEVAMLIRIKNLVQESVQEVPDDVVNTAFDRIAKEKKASCFDICVEAFETVKDTFSVVRKTIGFAVETITV